MAKLIYSAITSLDGYIEDSTGDFDWAAPDEEVLAFVNELERPIGTYLYGRRMYETMRFWETAGSELSPLEQDYTQLWQAAHKVVYSRSLQGVSTKQTRLEREFDAEAVREFVRTQDSDVSIGGPGLAGGALRSGVIDECQFFLNPISVGGGKPALPSEVRVGLELIDEHRFGNGAVFLRYGVTT